MENRAAAVRPRILGTGMALEGRAGTSLLELLVVLAIVAVLAGAVVLSVGLAKPVTPAERELARLERGLRLACERARLTGLAHGLVLEPRGYAFAFDDGSAWLRYRADSEAALLPRSWPEGVRPELIREGRSLAIAEQARNPQLVCWPSGELTPFALLLHEREGRTFKLVGHLLGRIERDRSPR